MKVNELQATLAREIVSLARRERYAVNHKLVTATLAGHLGVSRSPVMAALDVLESMGAVQHDKNRGYFLAKSADELTPVLDQLGNNADDDLYQRIADRHLAGELPETVNEAELMRLFDVGRSPLRRCLARILQDGWVERNSGHGWRFMPVVDSTQAYEESYDFRIINEPAAILSPGFAPDKTALESLLDEQRYIAAEGYAYMTAQELFDANTRLHETIVSWANNRFILHSLKRLDQLRRLVEYRQAEKRYFRQQQSSGHVEILLTIQAGDYSQAAVLMHEHLENAKHNKVYDRSLFTSD